MAQSSRPGAQAAVPPAYTLRVTFAYDANGIQLARSQRVEMIAPPSLGSAPVQGQTGYWFEVLDAHGALVHYRPLHDPLRRDLEVFSDDPNQSVTRIPNPVSSGEFTVLVPDLPAAGAFVLYGPPPTNQFGPSAELVRYSFNQLRRP